MLRQHNTWLGRRQEIVEGSRPLTLDNCTPPFAARIVECVAGVCGKESPAERDIAEATTAYFRSADFAAVPQVHISSLLFAAIDRRAVSGQKRAPNRGMMNDLDMVSTLLPYCDAMFLDKEIHALLFEKDVSERLAFGTQVFSMRNVAEFFDYLDQLRASAPGNVLQAVNEVYGDSWVRPFVEMYTYTDS